MQVDRPGRGNGADGAQLRTTHAADLDPGTRSAVRLLMDAASGRVSDDTFENVLGGVHAMVLDDGELVGHGSGRRRQGARRGDHVGPGSSGSSGSSGREPPRP